MKNMIYRLWRRAPLWGLLALAGLLALVVAGVAAVDWPQYQRNAQHTGLLGDAAAPFTTPAGGKLRWTLRTDGAVRSSATVTQNISIGTLRSATLNAKMLAGTTVLTVSDADDLHMGDILLVEGDYLGPITGIDRATKTITVADAATVDHISGRSVTVSLYRFDLLAADTKAKGKYIAVAHSERFMVGDQLEIGTEPAPYLVITGIQGNTLMLDRELADVVYPLGTLVRAGQPDKWAAYVGSDDGNLYAIDLQGSPDAGNAARLFWKSNARGYLGAVRGAPVVDKDLGSVYVASAEGRIFAFAQHGQFLWAYPPVTEPALGPINSSPVLYYNGTEGHLYFAVDAGTKADSYLPGIYKITIDGVKEGFFALAAGDIVSGLSLYNNGDTRLAFSTTHKSVTPNTGWLHTLDADLSSHRSYAVGPTTAIPVVGADGTIYIGNSDGVVYALQEVVVDGVVTLTTLWQKNLGTAANSGRITVTSAIAGNALFVAVEDTNKDAVANPNPYRIAFLSTTTGDALVEPLPVDAPVTGPLTVDQNGQLVAVTRNGSVYAFNAAMTASAWTWSAVTNAGMPSFPMRTAAALANGVVVVGSDDSRVYGLGDVANDALIADTNVLLPNPNGLWPFFHRDARRMGSLFDPWLLSEPGPGQPTLRWFASQNTPLRASPVVTDRTPDHVTRVYTGSEDGKLYAYNASTGMKITTGWADNLSGYLELPGKGPIRATPAVDGDGNLAVASLDGFLYLLGNTGAVKESINLKGNAVASPVFSKDNSLVYVATANSRDTDSGTYATTGQGSTNSLTDGDITNNGVTGAKGMTITYTVDDPQERVSVTHVRIVTANAGDLKIYRDEDDITTQIDPAYSNSFPQATTERAIEIDLSIDAQKIVWVNQSDAGDVRAFEISTAGSTSEVKKAVSFTDGDGIAVANLPFTGKKLVADVRTGGKPTYIHHLLLGTQFPSTVTITDANGQDHIWQYFSARTDFAEYSVPIQRYVTKITWECTLKDTNDILQPGTVTKFDVFEKNFLTTGGTVYAFNTADGSLKWKYPANAQQTPLGSVTASPVVIEDGAGQEVVYVATMTGQVFALREAAAKDGTADVAWSKHTFAPIAASPVIADNVKGAGLFVADMAGGMHLWQAADGVEFGGWPFNLPGTYSNSAAVTAGNQAYQVSNNGNVYLLNLNGEYYGDASVTVTNGNTAGPLWPVAQPPSYHPQGNITLVGRIKATLKAGNGQHALFGIARSNNSILQVIYLTDDNRIALNGDTPISADLSNGVELAFTVTETSASKANVTAFYRLPDTAGNYSGSFSVLGSRTDLNITGVDLLPYITVEDNDQDGYTLEAQRLTVYQDAAFTSANYSSSPLANWVNALPTSVYSSPVIDSAGRVYFGAESGALYCLQPGTGRVAWSYFPDRSSISTTLAETVNSGETVLPVTSVGGLRVGDQLLITRPDGSLSESLGRITKIDSDAGNTAQLTAAGPEMDNANPRKLTLDSVAGVQVGDPVNIQANLVGQPLRSVGTITKIVGSSIILDQDVPLLTVSEWATNTADAVPDGARMLQFGLLPVGIAAGVECHIAGEATNYTVESVDFVNDIVTLETAPAQHIDAVEWVFSLPYPIGSTVMTGSASGIITVSKSPANRREIGDRISVPRGSVLPVRSSPAIGPSQTVYIGAEDGVLYAVGPIGPIGAPGVLPDLPPVDTVQVSWNTFHADNQRTGFANRPGPLTNALRWYRDTGSTLESSPALGYSDETAPLGVLYVGTVDETGQNSYAEPRGSLIAYDASSGKMRWRFDDDGNMGAIYSSPTVFSSERDGVYSSTSKDESIVFGSIEAPRAIRGHLETNISIGDNLGAFIVADTSPFSVGMEVYISDAGTGANYESFGIIGEIQPDTGYLILKSSHVSTRDHVAGSEVILQSSQQGHLYCVDRSGTLRWTFPAPDASGSERIGAIHSSPVVDEQGNIYFGNDDGVIFAVDMNGKELWRYFVELPEGDAGVPEVVSSPALNKTGNTLFIGASVPQENRGYLLALDTVTQNNDERRRWIAGFDDENSNGLLDTGEAFFPFTASPMITTVDGYERIYIGSEDFTDYHNGGFYCFDPENGQVLIRRKVWSDATTFGAITSTAATAPESSSSLATGNVIDVAEPSKLRISSTDGFAVGLSVKLQADGLPTIWRLIKDIDPLGKVITLDTALNGDWLTARITLRTNEQIILVGTLDAKLLAFDAQLTPLWQFTRPQGGIRTSPAITVTTDDTTKVRTYNAFFGSNDHYLYAIRYRSDTNDTDNTPELQWEKNMRDRVFASPVVGEKTHAAGRAILYQASRDQYIYAFGDQTNYDGEPTDPDGPPDDGWVPPEERDQLVPSTVAIDKKVERSATNPDGNAEEGWWKFTVTVRNSGRGLIDHLKVYDNLPDSIASRTIPVVRDADLRTDEHAKISRPVAFQGTGTLNDLISRGTYTGDSDRTYVVTIDSVTAGNPDTFSWSSGPIGGTLTVGGTGITITGADQALGADGVMVCFENNNGHVVGDQWKFSVYKYYPPVDGVESPENKEAWEITWTNKDTTTNIPGDGFTLKPDMRDPRQQTDPTEYMRTFIFFVKVKQPKDPYHTVREAMAAGQDPYTSEPADDKRPKLEIVDAGGTINGLPKVHMGDNLRVRLKDRPNPNGELGINHLNVEGKSYNGVRDEAHSVPVRAHKETPVQNDWLNQFRVRLYYNGYAYKLDKTDKNEEFKLVLVGDLTDIENERGNLIKSFSSWNQIDPETGRPLSNNLQLTPSGMNTNATDTELIIPLRVTSRPFTFTSSSGNANNLGIMPYAWRVTIQQGKSRLNQKIIWGSEIPCLPHVQPQVLPEAPSSPADTRGEWSPDFIIPNPVDVIAGTDAAANIPLGSSEVAPGNTATSPAVLLRNLSKWEIIQSNWQRVILSPMDLRLGEAIDWNADLTAQAGYSFGALPLAGARWDGFRYDPYRENHLVVGSANIDMSQDGKVPIGQDINMRLTRRIPLHQPENVYRTMGDVALPQNFTFEDTNSNGKWDIGEIIYLDADNSDDYSEGDPCLAPSAFTARLFVDMNGNRVWDQGEPFYAQLPNSFIEPLVSLTSALDIARLYRLRIPNPVVDMGRYALSAGTPALSPTERLENGGNTTVTTGDISVASSVATTVRGTDDDGNAIDITRIEETEGELQRVGMAGVRYSKDTLNNALILPRLPEEIQPIRFGVSTISPDWVLPKSPAGSPNNYGRPFTLPQPIMIDRQPTGTYTGSLLAPNADTNPMISVRVNENRFSMIEAGKTAIDPRPTFDDGVNGNWFWTNYLTGTESWPTAMVLPEMGGDLGVWVASNTPQYSVWSDSTSRIYRVGERVSLANPPGIPGQSVYQCKVEHTSGPATKPVPNGSVNWSLVSNPMIPESTADTNIWFRQTKRLSAEVLNDVAHQIKDNHPIYTTHDIVRKTRASVNQTGDLIILRKKRASADDPSDVRYGRAIATDLTTNTITVLWFDAINTWTYDAADTIMEVVAHPWVPLFSNDAMNQLRTKMANPGVVGDTGPKPIRFSTPSVTRSKDGKLWLVWSVSGVRSVTKDGKTDHVPFSRLAYRPFNLNAPTDTQFLDDSAMRWVEPATPRSPSDGVILLAARERPVLLTDIDGTRSMVIYEGGTGNSRGLYYAITTATLDAASNWTIDLPLTEINQSFTNVGSPQAWVDADNQDFINLVFQGRRSDGNTDLYYARLKVVTGTPPKLVVQARPDASEIVANASLGVGKAFTLGTVAWGNAGVAVKVNNTAATTTLTPVTGRPDMFTVSSSSGTGVLEAVFSPLQGVLRITKNTFANTDNVEMTVTGKPYAQRLTTNLAADINPTVSIEPWRYLEDDLAAGGDSTLETTPRIWLFWTRQHTDGLGNRAYFRTFRLIKPDINDTTIKVLQSERRGEGGTLNVDMPERMLPMEQFAPDGSIFITRQAGDQLYRASITAATAGSTSITVDKTERFVPGMTVYIAGKTTPLTSRLVVGINGGNLLLDETVSVQVGDIVSGNRREAGLWVLSTASRSLFPTYETRSRITVPSTDSTTITVDSVDRFSARMTIYIAGANTSFTTRKIVSVNAATNQLVLDLSITVNRNDTIMSNRSPIMQHDLFLQSLSEPVPDSAPTP